MSEIDPKKDDLATQKMVEMMEGSASEEEMDVDALLNSISEVENQAEPESVEQVNTDEEAIDSDLLEQIPTAENELQETMHDMDALAAVNTISDEEFTAPKEASQTPELDSDENSDTLPDLESLEQEPIKSQDSQEAEEPEEETTSGKTQARENQEIEQILKTAEASTEELNSPPINESNDLDNLDELLIDENAPKTEAPTDIDELIEEETEEQIAASAQDKQIKDTDTQAGSDLTSMIEQTNQSVEAMSKAVDLDSQTQEIIDQLSNSAQMTTKIALSTAQKAQESIMGAQEAIEKTFAAIQRAKQITESTHYQIDMQEMKNLSSDEVAKVLQEIKQKNEQLKEANSNLSRQIAELHQS